uniref:Uncharacterized protein n=1 Tax=Medicago truncatula TaxID=3880 RepID=Q2HUJ9_MEDTR|nr:hypothetical protein MtrDRAFT_AC149131g20v2 [Medicago truncatula]
MTEASKVIHNWFYDNCTKCTIKAKTPNDQFKCERGQVFEQEGKKIYISFCLWMS